MSFAQARQARVVITEAEVSIPPTHELLGKPPEYVEAYQQNSKQQKRRPIISSLAGIHQTAIAPLPDKCDSESHLFSTGIDCQDRDEKGQVERHFANLTDC